MTGEIAVKRSTSQKELWLGATRGQRWLHSGAVSNGIAWVDREGGMLNLESGDRIELFDEDAPATTIRATVGRLCTGRDEGMSPEVKEYVVCWIEITVDEPSDMDAKQVVLLGTDFQYRLNGRRVTVRKRQL